MVAQYACDLQCIYSYLYALLIHYYDLQDQEKNEDDMCGAICMRRQRPFPKCGIVFIRQIGQKLSRGKLMAGLDWIYDVLYGMGSSLLQSMVVVVDAHIYYRQARAAALVCVNGQARWPPESDAGGEPGKKTLFLAAKEAVDPPLSGSHLHCLAARNKN